jgi:hypothetical protein
MFKIVAILVLVASLSAAQDSPVTVIDLTHTAVRRRYREPTTASASGNSVGYQGGIRQPSPLNLELISLKRNQSDEVVILIGEFELRNVSREDLDIPVDPSSRDLEPASPATPYRYLKAYIWLAAEPRAKESMPTTGLFLYGARSVPSSLRTLKPGQAMRIRAKIPASSVLQDESGRDMHHAKSVRAFLAVFNESITPQRDGLHSSTEEVFPAISSSTAVEPPL